jgi:hypothetical protein
VAVTTEIAPSVYRISIFAQRGNVQFNHSLVKDDEPRIQWRRQGQRRAREDRGYCPGLTGRNH